MDVKSLLYVSILNISVTSVLPTDEYVNNLELLAVVPILTLAGKLKLPPPPFEPNEQELKEGIKVILYSLDLYFLFLHSRSLSNNLHQNLL